MPVLLRFIPDLWILIRIFWIADLREILADFELQRKSLNKSHNFHNQMTALCDF